MKPEFAGIAQEIKQANADIICLQEFSRPDLFCPIFDQLGYELVLCEQNVICFTCALAYKKGGRFKLITAKNYTGKEIGLKYEQEGWEGSHNFYAQGLI